MFKPLFLPFFCLVSFATSARAQEFRGPLPAENARPLQAVFFHFRPESPETVAFHSQKYGVQLDLANNLLIPNIGANGAVVEEDFETQRLLFSYRKGLKHGWEIGADAQIVARNGGILDAPIEAYHNLLGLDGNGQDNPIGRENRARGRSVFRFQDAGGSGINAGSEVGLGDTSLQLKKQLSAGRFASAARLAAKIPTGSAGKILGSGGIDFGAALDVRYAISNRIALAGYGALLKFGAADVIPNARKSGVQGGLSLEYRGKRGSLVAQTDAASRVVQTGNSFADRTPVIVSVGYKRPMGKNRTFWTSFSENGDYTNFGAPFFGSIGPDFTLSLGMEWKR